MKLYPTLIDLLKTDPRFVDDDGELVLAAVQDSAWKMDHDLMRLLLANADLEATFFDDIDGHRVFNLNTFIDYISQKDFLDNSYTRFKNRIGLTVGGRFLSERGEVALVWPYKDTVLEGGQTKEEETRKEIFFNEVLAQDEINRLLAPKVLTNFARHAANGTEPVTDFKRDKGGVIRDNLIIKGNNLLAVHTLTQQFRGQVKLIYADPPYNTPGDSNTFGYNNNFNHSTWLTFMKNRLEVAKDLLREDGVLVATIDDNEYAHLKLLCDEVFDRENYLGTIVIQSNPRGRTTNTHFATCHEYALFYAKDIDSVSVNYIKLTKEQELEFDKKDESGDYRLLPFRRSGGTSTPEERPNSYYPVYYNEKKQAFSLEKNEGSVEILPIDKLGKRRVWRQTRPSFLKAVERGDMVCRKSTGKWVVYMKDRVKEGRKPKTIWTDSKYDASANGTMLLKGMFNGEKVFSYPKSLYAVKDTIDILTERGGNDTVLDFFAGSGTTAHAVVELNREDGGNRQFILCEQMDYVSDVTVNRVGKAAVGQDCDFIYCELMKYNEAFMERIQTAKTSKELLEIWQDMAEGSFLNWYVNSAMPEDALRDFEAIGKEPKGLEKQKHLLAELLDKNQLYVNLSEIDDAQFKVSKEDKALNKAFYGNAYDA
ncbi:DNA methyltransferase [Candidatus Cryosericum septentrionale]|jgi:adenine-specific DNA-methyltransferase|uniref:site-specific DNA-methyltransferase (adenine-specific) n=1 Tax=Candidatus Cryosericum septentrionale TaxID=2290913 RepID=A0A398DUM6_9BACT|nr:site-specific DNA-methyltransferase [Candidatus Cryosericum septentrionale]RIE17693.1 site-specific DNA-methyltransferase [Candidatus Cryosericum septentrionale]